MSHLDTQVNSAEVPSPKTSHSPISNAAHMKPHQGGCSLGRGLLAAITAAACPNWPSWMASIRQEPSSQQLPIPGP